MWILYLLFVGLGGISDVLMQVDVPVMSNADCSAIYGNVPSTQVCIDSAGGHGTCNVRLFTIIPYVIVVILNVLCVILEVFTMETRLE